MYILLIIIGVALIATNIRAIMREENNFNKAMIEAESNIDEVDMRLIEIRSEFAKTITELQREINDLKKVSHNEFINNEALEKRDDSDKNISNDEYINTLVDKIDSLNDDILLQGENMDDLKEEEKKDSNPKKDIKGNSLKVEEVKELLGEGLSEESIAQRLNIGKGEVLLIKELYLK
jgi:AraC-like DNA-binding protein